MFIERFFKLRDKGTTIRTEILEEPPNLRHHGLHHRRDPAILSFRWNTPGPSTVGHNSWPPVFGTDDDGPGGQPADCRSGPTWERKPHSPSVWRSMGIGFGAAGDWERLYQWLGFCLITLFHIRPGWPIPFPRVSKHSFCRRHRFIPLPFIGLYETGSVTSFRCWD